MHECGYEFFFIKKRSQTLRNIPEHTTRRTRPSCSKKIITPSGVHSSLTSINEQNGKEKAQPIQTSLRCSTIDIYKSILKNMFVFVYKRPKKDITTNKSNIPYKFIYYTILIGLFLNFKFPPAQQKRNLHKTTAHPWNGK